MAGTNYECTRTNRFYPGAEVTMRHQFAESSGFDVVRRTCKSSRPTLTRIHPGRLR